MLKGQNGITLVLAGVTISLTLGDKGIFTTAQQAAKNYTNESNKELTNLNTLDQQTIPGVIKNVMDFQ